MSWWQQLIVIGYGFVNLLFFIKGFQKVAKERNPYGRTDILSPFGIFVWGDAVIIGFFWSILSPVIWFFRSWYFFLLILSLFWVVRSFGEILYWMSEQFAQKHHNPPETLALYSLFKTDALWFMYQLIWQCILILSLFASLYFGKLWFNSF